MPRPSFAAAMTWWQGVRRPVSRGFLVALSYVVLACLVYWPYWPWDSHHMIDCVCGDPVQEVWFLDWTRFAMFHGHNPFLTQYLNAPTGANLALNTSFPLLGFLAAPITATLGPIAAYNILLRLALATSAFAMYWVLRRYTNWTAAAYLGGLLYGFSPYMIGHAHRHLFLTFVPLVPLFIPVVDNWIVRANANPWRAGAWLGLLTALEFLISPEIALSTIMFVGVGLAALAVRHRHVLRARLAPLWRGLVAASAGFLLVGGYPLWLLVAGPYRPIGAIHDTANLNEFRGDLLSPVIGTKGEVLTPHAMAIRGDRYVHGSVTENGFYLGIVLLVLLAFLIVKTWRSSLVMAATVSGVVAFVFGLGNKLLVNGHTVLDTMPFSAFGRSSILQNFEAARFSMFMQLGAAIVLAVGLDRVRTTGWRVGSAATSQPIVRRSVIVFVIGVVALVPLIPQVPLETGRARIPTLFTSAAIKAVPQGSLALTFPFDRSPGNDPMLWQTASKMRFRILGGEVFVPATNRRSTFEEAPPSPPNIDNVLLAGSGEYPAPPTADPLTVAAVRAYLLRYRIGVVFIDPTVQFAEEVRQVVSAALNTPPDSGGQMYTWLHVQQHLAAS